MEKQPPLNSLVKQENDDSKKFLNPEEKVKSLARLWPAKADDANGP